MAENWKSCFEEELLCPICLQVFVEPVQLPCKHNFCRACIGEAWAKESVSRCPECNNVYPQKPALEKNLKLSNIVEKFNSFTADAAAVAAAAAASSAAAAVAGSAAAANNNPAASSAANSAYSPLCCRYCRSSPAQKVCLRCDTGCCQAHVAAHLQAASVSGSHLLIEAGDARAWSCAQHDAYRLLHCETDQVAVCRYCYYMGSHHGHSICDLEVRRNEIRQMLMKQQERLSEREQDIEEQIYKLKTDKSVIEEKVHQLKEEVRLQYEKMRQILEEDLGKTLELIDKTRTKFCDENASQVHQLNERLEEAKKLLNSVQKMWDRTEDISFMKNTKSVKILLERTQACTGNGLPPPKFGHLQPKPFLSEIGKKEKHIRKLLEGTISTPVPFLQSIPAYTCNISSTAGEKRKHSTAFPMATTSGVDNGFLEVTAGNVAGQFMGQGGSVVEGQSTQSLVPCSSSQHIVGLTSGPQPVHTGSVFSTTHYPNGTPSQQSVLSQSVGYGGRKILVCSVDNCFCSGVPSVSNHNGHQPYSRSGTFPWSVTSQEYAHALPPAPSVPQSLISYGMGSASHNNTAGKITAGYMANPSLNTTPQANLLNSVYHTF
ncbi:E3 ubiquitin-protein ligase TRIM8-like [Hypanus sabinus]|uniref:E3 ubiquitin-protein ligase TRIM8-like n=1 Tax=Hypanus sabinus TaxID=79690 RepID=UPI0028C38F9F|nr:E3 ubiquitin-protein ligase TRIM8-like [Hypanus sabinus]